MAVPRTKTAVRALLGARGLSPRRLRGQCFLVDGNLIDFIVRTADVKQDDCVLEVGTGTGILTDALADRAGSVFSCDLDAGLQELARGLREWPPSVRFLNGDILAGKHRLNPEIVDPWLAAGGRARVISNLPYSVATPFLANLLWDGVAIADALVLVQKEAAQRFVAPVGSSDYGPMTIAIALLAKARVVRDVGPQVFWPQPRVMSSLLHLAPTDPQRARELRDAGLPELLRRGFAHRRKTLRRNLDSERLEAAGIDPGARPQEVSPDAWLRLLTVPPA